MGKPSREKKEREGKRKTESPAASVDGALCPSVRTLYARAMIGTRRSATAWLFLAAVGCSGAPATPGRPAPSASPTPSVSAAPPAVASVQRTSDGRCTPEPRPGTPCAPGQSWCVLDWGKPGGHSSALWCRGGVWHIEEEANLP